MDETKLNHKRIGVIDLGTNTFNLLIAEVNENGYRVFYKKKISVKLGERGIYKDFIAPEAFKRGIEALKKYKIILETKSVSTYHAVATSAIRSAENGKDFVIEVAREIGIQIEVIDGNKEAELIYFGVKQAMNLGEKPKLIVDIGGGSTEFIIANHNQYFWRKSYRLGVARILEVFKPYDPVRIENVIEIDSHLSNTLNDMIQMCEAYEINTMIGSSGSFETIAEMICCKKGDCSSWKKNPSYSFDFDDYSEVQRLIYSSSLEERLKMEGLNPIRADMIVVSIILINFLLNKLPILHMFMSSYALKEGLIKSIVNN